MGWEAQVTGTAAARAQAAAPHLSGGGTATAQDPAAATAPPPAETLRVFVKRVEDASYAEVVVGAGASVAALAKAASSELGVDAPRGAVTLTREGASTPLDSTLSVAEALASGALAPRAKLFLVVHAPAPPVGEAKAIARYKQLRDALRAARAEPLEGGGAQSGAVLVRLPAGCGAEWPQLGPGAPLFVRSFYAGCFEGVLASFDAERAPDAPRKFTIIGNAGIGKSAFGAYLLWRAVQARRTVVYVSEKVKDAFILHGDGRVEAFTKPHFDDRCSVVLDDVSAVLICDGVKPPICSAFTVLITSPVRERWKEFDKCGDAQRLFFPVFSRREIEDMRRTCFPLLSGTEAEAGVQQRFEKWGGIPRYVLGKLDEDSQAELKSAVTLVNIDELFGKLGARQHESNDSTSHRLLHFKTAGEASAAGGAFLNPGDAASYFLTSSELGSPYIKRLVFDAFEAKDLRRLDELLARVPTSPAAAKLFGELYELGALQALLAGGEFDCCELSEGGKDGTLALPPSKTSFFASAAELASTVRALSPATLDSTIFVPSSTNYTAVDAALGRSKALVNFTINMEHELKLHHATRVGEGAAPVADALGAPEITVYWALPSERYDAVRRRRTPFPVTGLVRGALGASERSRVKQYALRVPLGPRR